MDKVAIWAPLDGLPGYEVSTTGLIRSVQRIGRGRWGAQSYAGRLIKAPICKSTGYAKVRILGKSWSVHRLVAKTFLLKIPGQGVVNHRNGIKTDNRVENLEWSSYSENNAHAYRDLGRPNPMLGKVGNLHHRSRPVEGVDPETGRIVVAFESQSLAAAQGYSNTCIGRCINGRNRTHKGLAWRVKQ